MLMMLPFEAPTIFEGIHKSYFRMPRVVKDQRSKFENDDLFRQLSHESAVKYTGFKDRPMEERQTRFLQNCQEGHTEISVVQSGNQFTLMFNPPISPNYATDSCDYKKEHGKVHLKSPFILNGVCVFWRGWIDIQRLEGFGCLEFDAEGAQMEESLILQDRMGSQFDHMSQKQQQQQQLCNNHLMNQSSPLGRLNPAGLEPGSGLPSLHHHMSPPNCNNQQPTPPSHPNQQQQQQASQQLQAPPLGLNTCIGPPAPPSSQPPSSTLHHLHSQTPTHLLPPPPPAVSMAESALHYSNAIAAAAVYQAFSSGQSHSAAAAAALHGLGGPASAAAIAPLAASLAATNGHHAGNGLAGPPNASNVRFPINNALNLCDVNSR